MSFDIRHGDCREVMAAMDAESVDAIVCDPPYGLGFMGKKWDDPGSLVERRADTTQRFDHVGGNHNPCDSKDSQRTKLSEGRKFQQAAEQWFLEALRVAKPGAHLLAFGGTRTYHRLACAIEDAGWEIRDCVMWVYGSGFPKSHDVSKAIDKAAGVKRGRKTVRSKSVSTCYAQDEWTRLNAGTVLDSDAITPNAAQWQGWGTALKPAWEPIIVARKPLCGTVAENVLRHGTGGINVDGCRVGLAKGESPDAIQARSGGVRGFADQYVGGKAKGAPPTDLSNGRWPANVIHDGSDEVVGLFPNVKTGNIKPYAAKSQAEYRQLHCDQITGSHVGDSGSAARFFYCAKASKADRDEGCEGLIVKDVHRYGAGLGEGIDPNAPARNRNHHPTVKPTALMRYLCRLVTPPGGLVLDPFCGSGSTGKAAVLEGFRFIGIEREAEYVEIAKARIAAAVKDPYLFGCR